MFYKINQGLVEEVLGFYAFRARTPTPSAFGGVMTPLGHGVMISGIGGDGFRCGKAQHRSSALPFRVIDSGALLLEAVGVLPWPFIRLDHGIRHYSCFT